MADRQVTSFNGVDLPSVKGWQWVEGDDGTLALTDVHVTTGVGPAEIYVHDGILFTSAGYNPVAVEVVLLKALLEANRV